VNFYGEGARMGLHQDRDEGDFAWPVVSISLGDAALFRVGGTARGGPTQSVWLNSGDVAVLGGAAGLSRHRPDPLRVFHAVARRRSDQPDLEGGRRGRRLRA